jgi:hypothetical protein
VTQRVSVDQDRLKQRRYLNVVDNIVFHFTNGKPGPPLVDPATHENRTNWLRRTNSALYEGLKQLTEIHKALDTGPAYQCPRCGAPADQVRQGLDPMRFTRVFALHPCGHPVTKDQAMDAFGHGAGTTVTAMTGANLAAAELDRLLAVEEYDLAAELAALPVGDLAWGLWRLIDRAGADPDTWTDEQPPMWPLSTRAWQLVLAEKDPRRLKVIAAAVLCGDIDRDLAANPPTD